MIDPVYLSADLERVADALQAHLSHCRLCPWECGVDRLSGQKGRCRATATCHVAKALDHRGEEPPLSGTRGSGTVFFSHCHLGCVYCQNWQISQGGLGHPTSPQDLARTFLSLQERGCHNLNWVSATHYLPQAVQALALAAREGLRIPLVLNSNGWESLSTLALLDGVVDIYLPDARYDDEDRARRETGARDYAARNAAALDEMYRQAGPLWCDDDGIAIRGVIVRHLVLPGGVEQSKRILARLRHQLGTGAALSLMSQYSPEHRASRYPDLARRVTRQEYEAVLEEADRLGLDNGWRQPWEDVDGMFVPDFEKETWR